METSNKILIATLAVVLIGMTTLFIGALSNGNDGLPEQRESLSLANLESSDDSDTDDDEATDGEQEVPITGNALEEASKAALDYIGEGRVTDSEIGDEEGYYEIEITLDNGKEADVHLDENFKVLSVEYE